MASRNPASNDVNDTYSIAEAAYASAVELFLVKRDYDAARDALAAFIEEHQGKRDTSELVDRANVHLRACETRLEEESKKSSDPRELLLLGTIAGNQGRTDAALSLFDDALAAGADAGQVHYARAAALSLAERFDEAAASLREAIEEDQVYRAYSLGDPDLERLRETASYAGMVDPPESEPEAGTELMDEDAGSDAADERF